MSLRQTLERGVKFLPGTEKQKGYSRHKEPRCGIAGPLGGHLTLENYLAGSFFFFYKFVVNILFFFLNFFLFIYLVALGLSCGRRAP